VRVQCVLHARCGASCMPGAARPCMPGAARPCMPGAARPACPARRVLHVLHARRSACPAQRVASCMPGAALNSVLNSVRNVFTQYVMYLLSA